MMELHKKINEDAAGGAVGAGSVAVFAMPLMRGATLALKRQIPQQEIKVIKFGKKRKGKLTFDFYKPLGLREAYLSMIKEEDEQHPDFDQTQVIGKLKSLEQKNKVDRDHSVTFGLEDADGNIVRVMVQAEQADEFEKALSMFLAGTEEDNGEMPEIPEVLFKLRKQFNILDVQWPEVQEDQEQTTGVEGQPQPGAAPGTEPGAEQPGTEGDLGDMVAGGDVGGEADAKSLLQQVIDMMKADAEARKADAEARSQEAKNRGNVAVGKHEQAKVKREEELLDMEDYEKKKKEEDQEAKQLAKLAKWKHQVAKDEGGLEGGEEVDMGLPEKGETQHSEKPASHEEEQMVKTLRNKGKIHPREVADFILKRVK